MQSILYIVIVFPIKFKKLNRKVNKNKKINLFKQTLKLCLTFLIKIILNKYLDLVKNLCNLIVYLQNNEYKIILGVFK